MPKRTYGAMSTRSRGKRPRVVRRRARVPRYRPKGTRIVRGGTGIGLPDRMYFKHKYAEVLTLAIPASPPAPATYRYSVNSLNDPNSSGAGHQPYYYDEVANLFNHYTVLGSKFTVKATKFNYTTTTDVPIALTTWIEDDTVTPASTNLETALELGRNTRIIGSDDGVVKATLKWSRRKTWRNVKVDATGAAVGANPAEQQFFYIAAQTMDQSFIGVIYLTVEIEYFTCWTERKSVNPS